MYSCIFGVSHRLSRFVFLAVICTKLRWLVPVSLFSPPPLCAPPSPSRLPPPHSDPVSAERLLLTARSFNPTLGQKILDALLIFRHNNDAHDDKDVNKVH